MKSISINRLIFYFAVIILMLASIQISWLWSFRYELWLWLAVVIVLLFGFSNQMFQYDRKISNAMWGFVALSIISIMTSSSFILFIVICNIFKAFIIISILFLKEPYKRELFDCFVKVVSLILIVSIPAWILYLLGDHFQHGDVVDIRDGFHFMYNYGFFVTNTDSLSLYPRFCSIFLEPGWVGTICCFLLIGLQLNLKKIETWLCLAAVLLSMSLSAVMNLTICLFLCVFLKSKHKIIYSLCLISVFVGLSVFAMALNRGNNALNRLIIERLAFDEDLGIVGNNRTNYIFDGEFESMMNSSNRWFGTKHTRSKDFVINTEWYNHSSGIKKELYDNGLIGTGAMILFLFLVYRRYNDFWCFIFLVCFLLAAYIRNLWRSDCYLILYIVTMSSLSVMRPEYKSLKEKNKNVRVTKK